MAASGTGAFQIDTAATTLTLTSTIGGSGALAKTGAGTLIIGGLNNTYTGGTIISAGALSFSSTGAVPSTGLVRVMGGGGGASLACSGAYTTLAGWINSGKLDPASTGVLQAGGGDSSSFSLNNFPSLWIGTRNATLSGNITSNNGFRFVDQAGGTFTNNSVLADSGGTANSVTIYGGQYSIGTANNTYSGGTIIQGNAFGVETAPASTTTA